MYISLFQNEILTHYGKEIWGGGGLFAYYDRDIFSSGFIKFIQRMPVPSITVPITELNKTSGTLSLHKPLNIRTSYETNQTHMVRQTTSRSFTKLIDILCTALVKGGARQQCWHTRDAISAFHHCSHRYRQRNSSNSSSKNTKATAHKLVLCGLVWTYAQTGVSSSTHLVPHCQSKQWYSMLFYSVNSKEDTISICYRWFRNLYDARFKLCVLCLHISGRRGRSLHRSLHLTHYVLVCIA